MKPFDAARSVASPAALLAVLALAACGGPPEEDGSPDGDDVASASAPLCFSTQLTSSSPGPMPPGSSILLTATGTTCGPGQTPLYRFLYRRAGGGTGWIELRGWSSVPTATFSNSGLPSGRYRLQVRARNAGSTQPYDSLAELTILSGRVCDAVTLAASPAPPRLPGVTVALTAAATCTAGTPEYRFLHRRPGETFLRTLRGWGGPTYSWNTAGLTTGEYELVVQARRAGNPSWDSRATIPYRLGVPNLPPTITSNGGGPAADLDVYENMPPTVTTVVATDPDPGDSVGFAISGGADAAAFGIQPWGELFFRGGPRDFEAPADADGNDVYEVEVQASDGRLADTQLLRVRVTDVPDDPIAVSVLEGMTFVADVVRRHPGMPLPVTTYLVQGGADAARFTVDATTGHLAFAAQPDHEAPTDAGLDNVYEVTVWLLDGSFLEEQRFRVTVTDFAEVGPELTVSVPEDTTQVAAVAARHPSLRQGPVVFTISGGSDASFFAIDAFSGLLSFASPPDYESPRNAALDNRYRVEVTIANGAFAEVQPVTAVVTDVAEPIRFSVPENRAAVGVIAPRSSSTCPPAFGGVRACAIDIVGGRDAQHFRLGPGDSVSARLSFDVPWPDYEHPADADGDNVYEVVVRISDLLGLPPPPAETQVFHVTVLDAPETVFLVPENVTGVATFLPPGLPLPGWTYAIVGGTDRDRFTIEPSDPGLLSFVVAPDFEHPADSEGDGWYEATILAENAITLESQVTLAAVFVMDVDEPPIIAGAERISVPENTTAVLTVRATDPEGVGTMGYSIAGGADASRFAIDPVTGALSFRTAPDFEAPGDADGDNLYVVTVQASDGNLASTLGIGVTVTDAPEADVTASMPILLPAGSTTRDGGENAGIPLGLHAELTDTDGSETLTVAVHAQFGEPMPGATIGDGVHSHTFGTDPAEIVDVSTWNVDAIVARQAADVDADLLFLVTARSTESNGGATAETSVYVTARFYTLGTGVAIRALADSLCQVAPGACLDGPVGDLDGDGLMDPTEFGRAVRGGGDFDGDGHADLAVGAFGASPGGLGSQYAGAVYVVRGGPGGLAGAANAALLDGQNGFRLDGVAALDNLGREVDLSGDLDGDGFDDLVVSGAGVLFVLYGHAGPFPPASSVAGAVELYRGSAVNGAPVATADVNGDGLDDLVEGWIDPATGTSAPGAHVIYGSAARLAGPVDWTAMDGTTQSILVGAPPFLGGVSAVAAAGDVNGDGYDDVLVGDAPLGEYGPGTVYVAFGNAAGFGARLDLTADLDGTTGFTVTSSRPLEIVGLGTALGSAGDVNGDGFDDLVVGAPNAIAQHDPHAGVSYVIFGHAGPFPASLDLAQLTPARGFRIEGAEAMDETGYAVAGVGDVNGDGLSDLAVGALRAAQFGYRPNLVPGDTYVVFGQAPGPGPVVDAASLAAGEGARLEGGSSIWAVSPAGDSDGDGLDEVAIGAPDFGAPGAPGANGLVYRVRGDGLAGPQPRGIIQLTAADDVLTFATTLPELIQGLEGDDVLDGGGGDDVILAGPGDDRIVYRPGARRLSGGPGFDTLAVTGDLDLRDPLVTRRHHLLDGLEGIDLRDGAANVLTLDLMALTRLLGDRAGPIGLASGLVVLGDAGDTVRAGPDWTPAGTAQDGGVTFDVYRSSRGRATLWVEESVGVQLL